MILALLYLLLVISIGVISGYMIVYINLTSHKNKRFPYYLILVIIYFLYIVAMLGLAQAVWWVNNNFYISELIKGIGTVLMLLSVAPSTRLTKKYFDKKKSQIQVK